MQKIIHRADSRGRADHGWLNSRHSFSFAQYYNPERMGFGKLRVLNDDVVAPAGGFGTHPHDNMEIVSIPLSGSLRHKDSMGNVHEIRAGEVQIMSAGTGLTHSEYNGSDSEPVNFLQIWVLPDKRNIEPRYDQKVIDRNAMKNSFQVVVSPIAQDGAVQVNQDAWFSLAELDTGIELEYRLNHPGNGVYCFLIEGAIEVDGDMLASRDAAGFIDADALTLKAREPAKVLVIEVPMRQAMP